MADLEQRSIHWAKGDRDLGDGTPRNALTTGAAPHRLDSEESRATLRQLLQWFYFERDRQAENRLDMAMDADFYDGLQWDPQDAATLESRGQVPLVFNEVAPMVDWIIGTERRNRVDWKVLPRAADDVQMADVKTKVLKYVSDVNRVPFARSRAFADAVKSGLGWLDDGVRDDPTKDVLYSNYEDWRCVLHDSLATGVDGDDGRYIFRWRWVDEDVACLMFPDRKDRIKSAVEEFSDHVDPELDEESWVTPYDGSNGTGSRGTLRPLSAGLTVDAQRRRVRLIECQYRKPAKAKIIVSGPLKGAYLDERDQTLLDALGRVGGSVVDRVTMRVYVAVFTESALLAHGPSIFRHNRFSLTPVLCYRRGRDRMPYGVIRRVRDIQRDLNKRASKALWLMNTNQLVMDEGAVDDIEATRDEAQQPDGVLVKRSGKALDIRRDTDQATGQMQLMAMDAQSIQKSAGVSQENMGRQTNAVSGEAIRARQLQGAVVTTEPFDNLRLAVQVQGEKQLSLVEQWYTDQKVIRLTGQRGALEWVKINTPEPQPDGSVRYLDDITASMADFVVAEQDYAGTLRQVMFDSMNQIAQRLPPEVGLRFLRIAFEYSDLPNKDEIASELRGLTGERDPNKEPTPEEAQAAQAQAAMQAEAMEMSRQQAMGALQEQQAKVRELNARAMQLEAQATAAALGADSSAAGPDQDAIRAEIDKAVAAVQAQAADQVDKLTAQLRQLQADQTGKLRQVKIDADAKAEVARIAAAGQARVAEITAASDEKIAALMARIEDLGRALQDSREEAKRGIEEANRHAEEAARKAAEDVASKAQSAQAQPAAPAAPATAAGPATLIVPPPAAQSVEAKYVYEGDKLKGIQLKRADGSTVDVNVAGASGATSEGKK